MPIKVGAMTGRYWSYTPNHLNSRTPKSVQAVHGCVPHIRLAYAATQHTLEGGGGGAAETYLFSKLIAFVQSHGPEQIYKPRIRRADNDRVDCHRQFARVPGSLACHFVQL